MTEKPTISKEDMEKRLSILENMIMSPACHDIRIGQIKPLKKEYEALLKEYLALPQEVKQFPDIYLKTVVTYESNHYRIIFNWNRWNLYDGTEYVKGAVIEFLEGKPVKVTYPHIGSDSHGKLVKYTFNIKLDQERPKLETPKKVSGFKLPSIEEVRKQLDATLSKGDLETTQNGPLNTNLVNKDKQLVKRGKVDSNFIMRWLNRKKD